MWLQKKELIGAGSFGVVYKGEYIREEVAIKELPMEVRCHTSRVSYSESLGHQGWQQCVDVFTALSHSSPFFKPLFC